MKTISLQELLIGPLALLCVVVVFVATILEAPQGADAARPSITGTASP